VREPPEAAAVRGGEGASRGGEHDGTRSHRDARDGAGEPAGTGSDVAHAPVTVDTFETRVRCREERSVRRRGRRHDRGEGGGDERQVAHRPAAQHAAQTLVDLADERAARIADGEARGFGGKGQGRNLSTANPDVDASPDDGLVRTQRHGRAARGREQQPGEPNGR
jgi:hypothetical protein